MTNFNRLWTRVPFLRGRGGYPHPVDGGYPIQPTGRTLTLPDGGIPILPNGGGVAPFFPTGGTPLGWWTGWVLPLQNWMGYPPPPNQDWMGVPPPSQSEERAAEWALATRWAVCLLRSRRRTFLLILFSKEMCLDLLESLFTAEYIPVNSLGISRA